MKKIAALLLGVFILTTCITGSLTAQVRKIPAAVTEAFKEKYPSATNVEWIDKISVFMAKFEQKNISLEARFNSKGDWQSTEQRIASEDLPDAIGDSYAKTKFAEWEIGAVHKISLPGNVVQYRIQAMKNDIQKRNLLFNSEGRLLKDNITL